MTKRKLLVTSVFLFLMLQIFTFVNTFGLFESNITAPAISNLAAWQIKVNSSNVTGASSSFLIPAVNWTASDNTLPGKAAPGSSAYFEIIIDPSGSEVSLEYEIILDFANLNNDKIRITSVKNGLGEVINPTPEEAYTGVILLADVLAGTTTTVRVDFVWENDDTNSEIDSTFVGMENAFLDVPISIKFSQYVG